jgi:NAD(P)-dependent dehydrogenase (short-subunit alcohol dehydrogenase family)
MAERDPLDFTGRAVLVTGGGRGVGRGISETFLRAGADVVVCGRTLPDELPSSAGRDAVFVEADVRDPEQVDALIVAVTDRFGRLDVLVNNAGGSPPADTATASPRFTTKIIELNLVAPLVCAQAAYAVMKPQPGGGVILNIASVSGTRANPGSIAYGAAKAGLINVTKTLGVEFAPEVRVVCVTVGMVRTEQAHMYYGDEEGIAAVGATVPMGRLAEPSDVGDACLFLASPLARYITGEQLVVHGGGELPAYIDAAHNTSS